MKIQIDVEVGTADQADQLFRELWDHITNDCCTLPFRTEYDWGSLTYAVNPPDTVQALTDLVERIIENEDRNGDQWDAHCLGWKLAKILEEAKR